MAFQVQNVTVPWVPLADFDWSFTRSGPLPWNITVWSILAVFTALPIWLTFELTVWIFYVFRKYRGLYFWSVLACTWGTTIHAIGFVLKFCVPQCNWIFATVLAEIGWVGMVTGFSVVLYSRLGLLLKGQSGKRLSNLVLAMIVTDAFLFHVPTIVFQFGVSNAPTHDKFLPYMAPMERVQVMAFSVQETIISAIYIHQTLQYLRTSINKNTRRTIALLIWVQIIVVLCDVIVIALDYCEYFTLKAVLHSFVYAFKLQLEFVILNDVKAMAMQGKLELGGSSSAQGFALRLDSGSPMKQSISAKFPGNRIWKSADVTVHSTQGSSSDEEQLRRIVKHPDFTASLPSGGVFAANMMSGSRRLADDGFVTTHPVTRKKKEDGYEELDMERQYLGRYSA
jgi:hypothetical protein